MLILGGTGEARALAASLAAQRRWQIISSLAGRVTAPALPEGEVRVGGFGGPAGLASWLRDERIDAVVDATHPFAARISASAARAAPTAGVPLLVLRRPGWSAVPGDRWRRVTDMSAAAAAVADHPGPALLTTGRGGLEHFAPLPHRFVIRCVDPPEPPLPADHEVLLARGPYTLAGERSLLLAHDIRLLVTKDSGGDMTAAKLIAARGLGIPVIVVDRPPLTTGAEVPVVADVEAALRWLQQQGAGMR